MKGGFFLGRCFGQAQKVVAADAVMVRKKSGAEIPLTVAKETELGLFGVDLLCDSGSENFSFANGLGDVEYKGGQEGEDLIDGKVRQEILAGESDHPLPDVVSDSAVNEDYAPHTEAVDSDSPRYYQYSLSGASGSNMERENSFTDLEMASGHVSDPGTYPTKQLESICTSPNLSHGVEAEENKKAQKESQKQVSLSALSEPDSHLDHHNAVYGHPQILRLSYESSSAGGEGRELANGSCVPTGGSPRSEGADQVNTSHAMFKLSAPSLALESQKRKPWWKVFLASNTNAHLEVNGGILGAFSEGDVERMSQVNGYISDADSRSGRVSPSILPGGASDTEREQNNSRRLVDPTSQVSRYGKEKAADNVVPAELLESEATVEISAFSLYQDDFSRGIFRAFGTAQKWDSSNAKNGSSRVDEWVSSTLYTIGSSTDDDEQTQIEGEKTPDSPTFPAASFFESEGRQQVAAGANRVGGTADNDAEMTKMVARLVNPLSAAADFSGVGLKVMPSLGIFGSLKTLNLSANSFVRIIPGSLPKSLQSLDISRNNIVVIEGLRELTRLRVLNLSFNRISRIGNGLSSCTSLKEVYLAGNKISEVEGLHRLSKVVVLDLSFNKLTTTKSMGQIAANNHSLKALNLLGNAVHSNLGDEQMRRFVTGICPQLLFLNKQALKPISHREALGKELKGSVKHTAKPSKRGSAHRPVSSHRRSKSGEVAGNAKGKSGSKEAASSASLVAHGEGHLRKGHNQSRSTSSKEMLPKGFVPLPLTANPTYVAQGVRVSGQNESAGLPVTKSDGVMLRDDDNWSPAIPRGIVQAH